MVSPGEMQTTNEPHNFKKFEVRQIFEMKGATPSYDKGDLVPIGRNEDNTYDYITRQVPNRGICTETGFISNNGLHEIGTFSLGVMSMKFFYREKQWYAGQFVKKITIKAPYSKSVDKYSCMYLETVLNGLSSKLLSVLVRDVEKTFYNSVIELPIDENGNIDFKFMSDYTKAQKKIIYEKIKDAIKENC